MKKTFTTEQIIDKLREAERVHGEGKTIAEVCKQLSISEQTFYRWRQKYGRMRVDEAKRLRELEKENTRLKQIVAELTLDKKILEEVARGNF